MPRWYSPSGFGPPTRRTSVFMAKNHGASGSVSRDSSAHSAVTLPRTRNPSTSSSSVSASARTMAAMSSSIVRTSPHPSSVARPRSTSTPVIDASLRWLPRIGSGGTAWMAGLGTGRGASTGRAPVVLTSAAPGADHVPGGRGPGRIGAAGHGVGVADTDPTLEPVGIAEEDAQDGTEVGHERVGRPPGDESFADGLELSLIHL